MANSFFFWTQVALRQLVAHENEFANRGKLIWHTGKLIGRLRWRASQLNACLALHARADGLNGPLFVWKLAGFQLGIDQVAVDAQLEASASQGDELELFDLLLVGGQQLARQTDGLRLVVSHRAVFQFHVHGSSPFATLVK